MIKNLDDYREDGRFVTPKESREYYDQVMDALCDIFDQERAAMDYAVSLCKSFSVLINLCMVSKDTDTPVDVLADIMQINPPVELRIVGEEEEDEDEPKACVIRFTGNRSDEEPKPKNRTPRKVPRRARRRL